MCIRDSATPNLKHKAMIATMYSGGLRVSEVTHLHYDDISRTNKTIHIRDEMCIRDRLCTEFRKGTFGHIELCYTVFNSMLSQQPEVFSMLPMTDIRRCV